MISWYPLLKRFGNSIVGIVFVSTNENGWLEYDELSLLGWMAYFQGLCYSFSGRVVTG